MILECPACHARFSVADSLIPADGRTVRCSKCAHAWHVAPAVVPVVVEHAVPDADMNDAVLDQLTAALNQPEVHFKPRRMGARIPSATRPKISAKPFMIAVPVLACVWLVLSFITYFASWSNAPVLSGLYRAVGVTPTEGLVFADVHMEREQEGSKTRFILTGSIRNHTSETRAVPTVRVVLKDAKNKPIWGREYPVNTELKAGDVYPFRIANVETTFAKNVASIVVDMGNSLQLLVR